jgi:hypothetical protein
MKPHIKVIQRNGFDIFVTSSMTMKDTNSDRDGKATLRKLAEGSRNAAINENFTNYGESIRFAVGPGYSIGHSPRQLIGHEPRQTSGNY